MMKILSFMLIMTLTQPFPLPTQMTLIFSLLLTLLLISNPLNSPMMYSTMLLDNISFPLILLTLWITLLMIKASSNTTNSASSSSFTFIISMLNITLLITFLMNDFLLFYIAFELSLIPTLLLILGWGYQPERLQAGLYLLFYTATASLPLLLLILWIMKSSATLIIPLTKMTTKISSPIMILVSLLAFLVKTPMFLTHLWLPKAHVEAPVAGSMILAGVLLKLGSYGMLRMVNLIYSTHLFLISIIMSISMVGGMMMAILCLRQSDMKSLIAYSSVVHMAMTITSILSLSKWGLNGTMTMLIGHGLCSSALFAITNMNYERIHSRNILLNKSMMTISPTMSLWWFLLLTSNMAAPPSLNLSAEIMMISATINLSSTLFFTIAIISFMSAAYSLFLFSFTQHNSTHSPLNPISYITNQEMLTLLLHWLPLNMLLLKNTLLFYSSSMLLTSTCGVENAL